MTNLARLHAQKAQQWIDEDLQDKPEDEYHAELTFDIAKKFIEWMAMISQTADADINLSSSDEYLNHFVDKVYKL